MKTAAHYNRVLANRAIRREANHIIHDIIDGTKDYSDDEVGLEEVPTPLKVSNFRIT